MSRAGLDHSMDLGPSVGRHGFYGGMVVHLSLPLGVGGHQHLSSVPPRDTRRASVQALLDPGLQYGGGKELVLYHLGNDPVCVCTCTCVVCVYMRGVCGGGGRG